MTNKQPPRKMGFVEASIQEINSKGDGTGLNLTLQGTQMVFTVLVALAALFILSDALEGPGFLNFLLRSLLWIWMVTWALGVLVIRNEMEDKLDWEEMQDLPRLD